MKTILLYGALGKKFGKKHRLDVKSAAEAIRALSVVVSGFKNHLIEDKETGYEIFISKEDCSLEDLHNPISSIEVVRIVPIVTGAGNNAKIVVGAILVAVAYYYIGGASTTVSGLATATTVSQIGVMLIISGVSGIILEPNLEPPPEEADSKPNYLFDGPVNTTRQGNPVPIGYGILRIGSQVISAGLSTE